jgi:hypothetical protein
MPHSVTITITAQMDGNICTVDAVVKPEVRTVPPDTQRLFLAMIETAARLMLGEMARQSAAAQEPAA